MPTSNIYLAGEIIGLVDQVPHATVLDVGPGWGKYAVLLREYLNTKPATIDAVEAWMPYVRDHELMALYDEVITADVVSVAADVLARYDVVLMVDVIEHLTIADAMDVLRRIPQRVVICTPVEFFDNGPDLPWTETHRSHWTSAQWSEISTWRPVEVCYQSHGGWLVRLGPLPT